MFYIRRYLCLVSATPCLSVHPYGVTIQLRELGNETLRPKWLASLLGELWIASIRTNPVTPKCPKPRSLLMTWCKFSLCSVSVCASILQDSCCRLPSVSLPGSPASCPVLEQQFPGRSKSQKVQVTEVLVTSCWLNFLLCSGTTLFHLPDREVF